MRSVPSVCQQDDVLERSCAPGGRRWRCWRCCVTWWEAPRRRQATWLRKLIRNVHLVAAAIQPKMGVRKKVLICTNGKLLAVLRARFLVWKLAVSVWVLVDKRPCNGRHQNWHRLSLQLAAGVASGGIAALVPGVSRSPLGQTDGRVRVLALLAVHLLAGWSAGLWMWCYLKVAGSCTSLD